MPLIKTEVHETFVMPDAKFNKKIRRKYANNCL